MSRNHHLKRVASQKHPLNLKYLTSALPGSAFTALLKSQYALSSPATPELLRHQRGLRPAVQSLHIHRRLLEHRAARLLHLLVLTELQLHGRQVEQARLAHFVHHLFLAFGERVLSGLVIVHFDHVVVDAALVVAPFGISGVHVVEQARPDFVLLDALVVSLLREQSVALALVLLSRCQPLGERQRAISFEVLALAVEQRVLQEKRLPLEPLALVLHLRTLDFHRRIHQTLEVRVSTEHSAVVNY